MSANFRMGDCAGGEAAARGRAGHARPLAVVLGLALAATLLVGCASRSQNSSGLLQPYRTDLPQGNYLTREMIEQVRPGLTREQVRAILGAPLLNPMFQKDRWDYVFRYQHPDKSADLRRVLVRFKDDRVASLEADELPLKEDPSDPALPGYRPKAAAAQATAQVPAGVPADAAKDAKP